jgi:hypothetical protein
MARRIQYRQSDGRYRQGSLSDFGLDVVICPMCSGFNPWKPGIEPKPVTCCQCGKPLVNVTEKAGGK